MSYLEHLHKKRIFFEFLKMQEKEMKREGSSNGLSVQSISGHSAVHSGSTLPSQQYNANTLRKGE